MAKSRVQYFVRFAKVPSALEADLVSGLAEINGERRRSGLPRIGKAEAIARLILAEPLDTAIPAGLRQLDDEPKDPVRYLSANVPPEAHAALLAHSADNRRAIAGLGEPLLSYYRGPRLALALARGEAELERLRAGNGSPSATAPAAEMVA